MEQKVKVENEDLIQYLKSHNISKPSIKRKVKDIILSKASTIVSDGNKVTIAVNAPLMGDVITCLQNEYRFLCINEFKKIQDKDFLFKKGMFRCVWNSWLHDLTIAEYNHNEEKILYYKKRIGIDISHMNIRLYITANLDNRLDYLIAETMKEHNIPVVFMEHGFLANPLIDQAHFYIAKYRKSFIDYYWFWNERNRKASIMLGIVSSDKTEVCGIPYQIIKKKVDSALSVLWVGEAAGEQMEAAEKLHETAQKVQSICKARGIPFHYKKHPKESVQLIKKYIVDYERIKYKDLQIGFAEHLIVMGGRTSALLEAAVNGNYVIQVIYDKDRVSNYIYKSLYQIVNVEKELPMMLEDIASGEISPKALDAEEIQINNDLKKTYCNLIDKIIYKEKTR